MMDGENEEITSSISRGDNPPPSCFALYPLSSVHLFRVTTYLLHKPTTI